MATDWRRLLTHINVEWKDRGSNHSRGNINIKCPWCVDDPSFHLGVGEQTGLYWCFRDNRHSGGQALHLVEAILRQNHASKRFNWTAEQQPRKHEPRLNLRVEAVQLLDDYEIEVAPALDFERKNTRSWNSFSSAVDSDECLDYLYDRGFDAPEAVCKRFDLRYEKSGSWSRRLLFPLTDSDLQIVSWTGRALVPAKQPRYLAYEVPNLSSLFSGRLASETLILVEGPVDALRINSVIYNPARLGAAGINGTYFSEGKIAALAQRPYRAIGVCLDPGASIAISQRIMQALSLSLLAKRYDLDKQPPVVRRLKLPREDGDPGDMSEREVREWLADSVSSTLKFEAEPMLLP